MKISFYLLLVCSLLLISCADEIINNYPEEEPETLNPPNLNVIHTSYSLSTIHSDHINIGGSSGYRNVVNLNIKFDKPMNRDQINKLIIVNTDGFGWEFYNTDLESKYSDTLGGYILNNLLYDFPSTSLSQNYKIKIYSKENISANDYEFILKTNFITPPTSSNKWVNQSELQLNIVTSNDVAFQSGEIIWLRENKEELGRKTFTFNADINFNIDINDVPNDAVYFYINSFSEFEGIDYTCKSRIELISQRFPQNVQIIEIDNYENLSFSQHNNEIFFSYPGEKKLKIYEFETMQLKEEITFNYNGNGYFLAYSFNDGQIYIAEKKGIIYSANSEGNLSLIAELNSDISSVIAAGKYIIAGIRNYGSSSLNGLAVINSDDKSIKIYTNNFYLGSIDYLIYNDKNKIIYGITKFSTVYRMGFNSSKGDINGVAVKSINGPISSAIISSDGTKFLTDNGSLYRCSENNRNDLNYVGKITDSYDYFRFTDDGELLGLKASSDESLDLYSLSSFSVLNSFSEFYAKPLCFFSSGDIIKVISINSESHQYYSESLSYSSLLKKKNFTPYKTYFYEMKEIIR